MTKNYDNWERLVDAVLDREKFKELSLLSSPSSSSSRSSSFSHCSTSQLQNQSLVQSPKKCHNLLTISRILTKSPKLPRDYSDLVIDHAEWKTMLPPGQHEVIWRSSSTSFSLRENKNCFMLGARQLVFSPLFVSASMSEEWIAGYPDSRFTDVVKVKCSTYIYIRGRIKSQMLSPKTFYAAYLVFDIPEREKGIPNLVTVLGWGFTTCKMVKGAKQGRILSLPLKDLQDKSTLFGGCRDDGWMEIEMGDFYVDEAEDDGEVEARLLEMIDYTTTTSLVVEGIEFRPKYTDTPDDLVPKAKKNAKGKGFFSSSKIEMIDLGF